MVCDNRGGNDEVDVAKVSAASSGAFFLAIRPLKTPK